MCFGILKSNEEKFEEFLKNFYNGNKEDNIFFNFASSCCPNPKDIANIRNIGTIYSFLDFYRKQTKIVFGKSLLENDLIKWVIFRHIYFKFKLKKPKDSENLPEGFFGDSSLKDLKLYEIEFLKFILIKYYPSDMDKILAWYDGVSRNKKLTYVEKTFLLQINGEINFFDLEISKCKVNINDNGKSLQVNLSKLLNNHFQSGADSRLMNNPNNFLSLYNKIIDIFSKGKIVIEKQDGKIVEIKITKKIKQDLIYRMFELCSGSEYYTIKKNGDSYYLFKCRGKGEFLSELEFGDIVRQGNRPSFFAHIFELKKENRDEAVRFLLKKLDEMLKDKLIDEIDKASVLLPFFINSSGKETNLYDKLLSKYKNDKEINPIIKNIFKKSKEYLFSDYLKNCLTEEEIKKEENEDEVSEDGTKKKKLIKNSGIRDKKKSKEARRKAKEEARRKAKEETRRQAEEEERLRKEEEARRKVEEEARRKAEEEERLKKEKEEKEKAAAEEARKKAEEEAARKAEEEERLRKEEEARRQAEEEARRQAEEEARRQAEEEARRKAEEERKKAEKERLEKERLEKEKEEKDKAVEEFLESIPKKPETNSVNNTQSVNRTPGKPTQEKLSTSKKPVNISTRVAKLKIFFEEEAAIKSK